MQYGSSLMGEVFFALCKGTDTALSLGLWLRYKHGEHASLAEMRPDPRMYLTADSYQVDYLCASFLSKYKDLATGIDTVEKALQSFTTSENDCKNTNERLISSRSSPIKEDIASVISTAQRKISKLLGPYSVFKIDSGYGWGPGATLEIPRRRAFVDTKLCELPISVTRRALPLIKAEIERDLHWSCVILDISPEDLMGPFKLLYNVFDVVESCIIKAVPKNAKTDRIIAVEPRGNGFLQKGVGAYIRSRLKSVGIDLDNQKANQDGAKAAVTDLLATVDLSAASDSMAIELVYELLPVDWALALDDLRSHSAILPGGVVSKLHKFSSMGNGFTFELESLLFWAIASSIDDRLDGRGVLVYGDDIIVGQECYPLLAEALDFLGFRVNHEKSFFEGLFYESCGKHYFNGFDVTPVYQKEKVESVEELIRLGNRLRRFALRCSPGILDPRIMPAWRAARRIDPLTHIFQLPQGAEGDDGWIVDDKEFHGSYRYHRGLRCCVTRPAMVSFPAHPSALLAWTLRRGTRTESPYRDTVKASYQSKVVRRPKSMYRWVYPTEEFTIR